MQKRLEELKLESHISPLPPLVLGGVLVVPRGLLAAMVGQTGSVATHPVDTQASAARARAIVMEIERQLGYEPADRETEYSLNKPEDFILAIVEFLEGDAHRVHYVREPFQREPDFGVTSVNYSFAELLERAEEPR